MNDLIHNFGINGYLLLAQIVNFLIILFILKKFAYKPILGMLEKRKLLISEGQKNAIKAEEALHKATELEKEILQKAHTESKTILAESSKQADEIITRANDKGKLQVEKMITEAREQISKDKQSMEKELAINVTSLAIDMLRKSMSGLINEADGAKIVENATKILKK